VALGTIGTICCVVVSEIATARPALQRRRAPLAEAGGMAAAINSLCGARRRA
jgi:hypothetical protein